MDTIKFAGITPYLHYDDVARIGSTDSIHLEDLPEHLLEVHTSGIPISKYHEGINEAKKKLIETAMQRANGNMTEAAALLGVNLTYLYRLIATSN